ncbi:MAG: acyltransferase [Terracidiphilus sp.]|jgi:peptidoglycan/LPS O-acetylase OafA/YrhL
MGTAPAHAEPIISAPAQSRPAHDVPSHDIPSLDGLRALSIAIVILSHTKSLLPSPIANSGLFRYVIGGGLHGVQIFFVISGYLITTLLLREYDRTGSVSFKRFYARRALRIFPPFYVYFAVLTVLWITGLIPEHWPTYLASATYTFVYLPNPHGWYVEHAWSLSIEEQFYLLWPALLLFAHRRAKSIPLALAVIALMPFVRIVLYLAAPNPERVLVTSSSADTLMVGCLLALLGNRPAWQQAHRRFLNAWTAAVLLATGFLLVPYLSAKLTSGIATILVIAFGNTLTTLSIGGILIYVIDNPQALAGRFLNLRLICHLGVISYSLYLWQQIFTGNPTHMHLSVYLLILAAAELSFWLIEKPAMHLRTHLNL